MRILGIETSCDETGVSILDFNQNQCQILVNLIYSQIAIHQPYGGVVPNLAKREHQKKLVPLFKLALDQTDLLKNKKTSPISKNKEEKIKEILGKDEILQKKLLEFLKKYSKPKIDLIAVTKGPGLAPALWPGVNFARALSFVWDIPLIGINHLEGHLFSAFLPKKIGEKEKINISKNLFPAIGLVISGGHTQLILVNGIGKYRLIGETRDDAAGECFDKTARLLRLDYPGGPAIAKEALKSKKMVKSAIEIKLPRPMINQKNYDFSFSGLKTAVFYLVEHLKKQNISLKEIRPYLANEIQNSINEVLVAKTLRAAKNFKVKNVILGGGVVANEVLLNLFKKEIHEKLPKIGFIVPEKKYTGDNASMIALVAGIKGSKRDNWRNLQADANWQL
ncbi:MAG: tRNA (adenosine(37)-N6)-threonylcarbamoyltransferase complex transferase subunit TsaD [Parcubacteria group bacterium]|nr:tRNA (adenosine(37)-N6)-threonylcarbamoyltransferase complex transferase subunit TsaD [Parcubacteria group bacterium]